MISNSRSAEERFDTLTSLLDVPPSYYEKAASRHRSLGEWFHREDSHIAQYAPEVFPQGSFRLGTVIKPISRKDEYDLDTVCQLLHLSKNDITQQELKNLVGSEVKAYAEAFHIKEPVVERKRCWRLDYSDEVRFHMDILPCLPDQAQAASDAVLRSIIALTCTSSDCFSIQSSEWPTSNPAGYAVWFERRMEKRATERRQQVFDEGIYASIQDVPLYALRTPLQRAIQMLKRHRDVMFAEDQDLKPISAIITTLAAHAYHGEEDVSAAVLGVLERMPEFVRQQSPRVGNPVNTDEDFADKWTKDRDLEMNFWRWHQQAVADVKAIAAAAEATVLQRIAESRLDVSLSGRDAEAITRNSASTGPAIITVGDGPKPWRGRA